MDPPHILHVFPSYGLGGVPIRFAGIINHFGERYRHTIYMLDGNALAARRIDSALDVRLVNPNIDKRRPLSSLMRIHALLRDARPDLLITHNWGAIEWALMRGLVGRLPHLHCESGFDTDEALKQIPRRVRIRRFALARSTRVIVPSEKLEHLATEVWRIPSQRVLRIPNGVDCALFDSTGDPAAAPGFQPREGGIVIGTVAPLRAVKNVGRLVRCFSKIAPRFPNAQLLVVGEGVDRQNVEHLAQELGVADRTTFTGHVDAPHLIYPLLDVFALTSDTEQMPNTVLQAMAASRAIVSVDVGDVRTNLSPENRAWVVEGFDEDRFADALAKMIADPALRLRLGAANRRHVVDLFDQSRMFERYGEVFDEVLGRAEP